MAGAVLVLFYGLIAMIGSMAAFLMFFSFRGRI